MTQRLRRASRQQPPRPSAFGALLPAPELGLGLLATVVVLVSVATVTVGLAFGLLGFLPQIEVRSTTEEAWKVTRPGVPDPDRAVVCPQIA